MLAAASFVAVAAHALALSTPARRIAIDVEVAPESAENDAEALAAAQELEKSIAYLLDAEVVQAEIKLRGCGSDISCMAQRLTPASIELAVAAVVNRSVSPALLSMQLIDVKRRTVVDNRIDELTGDSVLRMRAQAIEMFERAGFRRGGRLIVESTPADASIWIGAVAAKSGGAVVLPPGKVQLSASREGYQPMSLTADVARDEETRVLFELQESPSVADSPWLWIAVGTALVVAGTIATIAIVGSSDDGLMICAYRDPPGSGPCP